MSDIIQLGGDVKEIKYKTIDRNIWGPFVWYMMHRFSDNIPINNKHKKKKTNEIISEEEKELYHIFYMNIYSILPCQVCRLHYNDIIYEHPVLQDKITRTYLKQWVFKIHNIVNKQLGKEDYKYYKLTNDLKEKINNKKIISFINNYFINLPQRLSVIDLDRLYNFFIAFCKLYPDKKIRAVLTKQIDTKEFENIQTTRDLQHWYIKQHHHWNTKEILS